MVLTPLDIHNKEFSTKMRGYDQDEVNDYLDHIIKDYELVLKEKRDLEKSLKYSEEKVAYFNDLKDALNQSIIVAQEAADKVKNNARKESEIIVRESEKKADDIINEASAKARQIKMETDELKKQTLVFHQRLQVMLESQLEIAKSAEWEKLLTPDEKEYQNNHSVLDEVLGDEDAVTPTSDTSNTSVNPTNAFTTTPTPETTSVVGNSDAANSQGTGFTQQTSVVFPQDDTAPFPPTFGTQNTSQGNEGQKEAVFFNDDDKK